MGFFSDRGNEGDNGPEGQEYVLSGRTLVCGHCGNTLFWTREAQLNTAGMSFLDLDFLNKTADVYVCASCGHLEWFL